MIYSLKNSELNIKQMPKLYHNLSIEWHYPMMSQPLNLIEVLHRKFAQKIVLPVI